MRFWRRRRSVIAHPPVTPPSPLETGPSWMTADDWRGRLTAYRRRGRTDADIRAVIAHLERRGPTKPRTKAETAARARSLGYVARAEYMDAETEARALQPGHDGLPDARLQRERDRLLVTTSHGWVNPKSRTSWRYGLHSFALRGTGYYEAAVKAGRFSPGAPVRLVREPSNEYDPNAVAVYAETGKRKAGYVPKGQAKRLAKMLDAGADLVAISVRGSGAGSNQVTPVVLVCDRKLHVHLTR